MTNEREKELIYLIQKNKDQEAFKELYNHYYGQIYRYFFYSVLDSDIAKDLTSETFFQMMRSLWRFRWQGRPFSAWLFRLAHNQLMLFYRQKNKYCQLTLEECPELIAKISDNPDYDSLLKEEEAIKKVKYQQLRQAMNLLDRTKQSIIILRYFADKSLKEIADIMKLPENTVKSHIRRSLIKLKVFLTKEENNFLNEKTLLYERR